MKATWCLVWHRTMHKQMNNTTNFTYWWCRTCHRSWRERREF